jgi:DNA-binding transcriptional MocR family regulator
MQLVVRDGIVEFGWGHPDPQLLPIEALAAAAEQTLRTQGGAALSYGAEQGPGRLLELLAARCATTLGYRPELSEVFVSGGTSQALDLICTLFSRPGDTVLVEAPTYHLALRIFTDHGLTIHPIPGDGEGMQVELLRATLDALRARGERVAFLYIVPTFGNPSTATLSQARRQALVEFASEHELLIVEDDAYRELSYDAPAPWPLYTLAPRAQIIHLGSFAKILAPGLRLGWMIAAPTIVQRCALCGLLDSGGGVNHFTASLVAELLRSDALDKHIGQLHSIMRRRRNTLLSALDDALPADCRIAPVHGGFFVWIALPASLDSTALLLQAEHAGVSFLPGARFFYGGGGERYLRLSFSLLDEAQLSEGAQRLGGVIRAAGDTVTQ